METAQSATVFSTEEEEKQVSDFLKDGHSTKAGILEFLNKFCTKVAKFDESQWPESLGYVFKDAYQLVRYSTNNYV